MDSHRFDHLTRMLAAGTTRRSVLRALAAGAIAGIAGERLAEAETAIRSFRAPRRCSRTSNVPCDGGCCGRHDVCVAGQGCAPAHAEPCGNGYCANHLVCLEDSRCGHCANRTDFCGGECPPCPPGSACHRDTDCVSGVCNDGTCDLCLSGACEACHGSNECSAPTPICANGRCVECEFNAECPADRPICDGSGTCRRCQSDGDCFGNTPICTVGGTCVECQIADHCPPDRQRCDSGTCQPCQNDTDCQAVLGSDVTCQNGGCGGHCRDGRISGDESDKDCGGSCDPCANGLNCFANTDCQSGHCDNGGCVECQDSTQCLGAGEPICDAGACRPCQSDTECQELLDPALTCQDGGCGGHCTDGRISGDESDIDCGGSCGSNCAVGQSCRADTDCASGFCDGTICRCFDDDDCPSGQTCTNDTFVCINACLDGEKNGRETDVDCGGPDCSPCPVGLHCNVDADCFSGFCNLNTCACNVNADCPIGQVCLSPFCVPDCVSGAEAGADGSCCAEPCNAASCEGCLNGACVSTCDECEVCSEGACEPKCDPLDCQTCGEDGTCESVCEPGERCESGECRPPVFSCAGVLDGCGNDIEVCCGDADSRVCLFFDGTPCTDDFDCNHLRAPFCVNGQCADEFCFRGRDGSCEAPAPQAPFAVGCCCVS